MGTTFASHGGVSEVEPNSEEDAASGLAVNGCSEGPLATSSRTLLPPAALDSPSGQSRPQSSFKMQKERTLDSLLAKLSVEDLQAVLATLRTLLSVGLHGIPDVQQLMDDIETWTGRAHKAIAAPEALSVLHKHSGGYPSIPTALGSTGVRFILPDLLQVHLTLAELADKMVSKPQLEDFAFVGDKDDSQKCLLYLMPAWDWRERPPTAAQFWKAAHAVARDHNGDDWIAPHMTLHSRSNSIRALASKFCKMLRDLEAKEWAELLTTLRGPQNWIFDEDLTPSKKPSAENHHVLHKAMIKLPKAFRQWLFTNQDDTFRPRKQDVALAKQQGGSSPSKVPINAPFHVSLYSFRAALDLPQDAGSTDKLPTGSNLSNMVKMGTPSHKGSFTPSGSGSFAALSGGPSSPPLLPMRALQRKNTDYGIEVPREQALRLDLANHADWMWVFAVPGRTSENAVIPCVLSAVRLEELASGLL
mmetsp:Transcript_3638/g.9200  ORF Transcript_3638/g.9200 Transcript_3638/m.9200 type:complete len:474 (-) Transcript_3638:31-1452(-)